MMKGTLFAGIVTPLAADPEWRRYCFARHVLSVLAYLEFQREVVRRYAEGMRAFAVAFSEVAAKMRVAFREAETSFGRMAKVLNAK